MKFIPYGKVTQRCKLSEKSRESVSIGKWIFQNSIPSILTGDIASHLIAIHWPLQSIYDVKIYVPCKCSVSWSSVHFCSVSHFILLSLSSLSFAAMHREQTKNKSTTLFTSNGVDFRWKAMKTNNDVVIIMYDVMNTEQRTNQLMLWWQVRAPSVSVFA